MSTQTPTPPALIDTERPGVPLTRLIAVEARKFFDTRAGRWFSGSILGLVLIIVVLQAFVFPDEGIQDFTDMLSTAGGALGYFLPILVIMLVTSEWSQRTGLVTFTLEPRRARVVVAKLVASILISLVVLALAFGLAALGTVLAGDVRGLDVSWDLETGAILNFVLANVIGVLIGFAIATLLMNTAAAIVTYFIYSLVLPTIVGIVSALVDWFEDLAPWIEFNTAQVPLFTGDFTLDGEEWAQFATSGTLWLLLPLALGIWRLLRSEVK